MLGPNKTYFFQLIDQLTVLRSNFIFVVNVHIAKDKYIFEDASPILGVFLKLKKAFDKDRDFVANRPADELKVLFCHVFLRIHAANTAFFQNLVIFSQQ